MQPFEIKIYKSISSGLFLYFVISFFQKYIENLHFILNLILTSAIVFLVYSILLYLLKLEKEDLEVIKSIRLKIKGN